MTYEEYLVYSARCGDMEGVEEALGEKVGVNSKDEKGFTALHMACANGHLAIV